MKNKTISRIEICRMFNDLARSNTKQRAEDNLKMHTAIREMGKILQLQMDIQNNLMHQVIGMMDSVAKAMQNVQSIMEHMNDKIRFIREE